MVLNTYGDSKAKAIFFLVSVVLTLPYQPLKALCTASRIGDTSPKFPLPLWSDHLWPSYNVLWWCHQVMWRHKFWQCDVITWLWFFASLVPGAAGRWCWRLNFTFDEASKSFALINQSRRCTHDWVCQHLCVPLLTLSVVFLSGLFFQCLNIINQSKVPEGWCVL